MKTSPYLSTACSALLTLTGFAQDAKPPSATPPSPPTPPSAGGPESGRPPLPPPPQGEGRARGPEGPGRGEPGKWPPPRQEGPGGPRERGDRERGESDRPHRDRDGARGPDSDRRGDDARTPNRPVALKPTPYIGVITAPLPAPMSAQLGLGEGFGLLVDNVVPDGPAQAAGIQRYDVLKLLNDQQLVSPTQLATLIRAAGKDVEVSVTLLRKGQEQKVTLKIGEKMLPETPGAFPPDAFRNPMSSEFRERIEQLRRSQPGSPGHMRHPNTPPDGREKMKGIQQRLNEYQEGIRKWQEDVRRWQEKREGELPKPPEPPKLEMPSGPGSGSVHPSDILREIRPGGAGQVRGEWSDGSSRWDASRARVVMRVPEGEMELAIRDGRRTLAIRTSAGETVFNGAVDTPEERDRVPEPFRRQLSALETPPPLPPHELEDSQPTRLLLGEGSPGPTAIQ